MKVLYLSGAPRVSTKSVSGSPGPRAHVLGVIGAFKTLGHSVEELIIGDIVLERMVTANFEPQKETSAIKRTLVLLASDTIRFLIKLLLILKGAFLSESKRPTLVYERYGLFMGLGKFFKKKNGIWILESNAILSQESSGDRSTIFFKNLAKNSEAKAYRKCDFLVVVTEDLKSLIVTNFGIPNEKIIVVANGVDAFRFNPKINTVNRPNKARFVLGFVGNLMTWQYLSYPIQTIAKLRMEGLDIGLTIVGDGAEYRDLSKLVDELKLHDSVILTGAADWKEIPKFINGFDACYSGPIPLSLGKMYLSPLKLYEYLAMDKPVVASNYPDAVTLLKDSFSDYLFQHDNPDSLADLLRKLVSRELNADFSPLGKNVREELSWTSKVQSLLKITGMENEK